MIKRTLKNVWSPQRRNRRDVDVYLPSSYASGVRYPVVYMQDGQNLSDPAAAFAGTWDLEATIDRLAWRGIEAIYVGVHHAGRHRLAEYSPFPDPRHGGGDADAYLAFLVADAEAAHRSHVPHAPRSRGHRHPRIIDGRPHQPLRVLPLSVRIRARRRDEPVDLVRSGRDRRLHPRGEGPRGRLYLDVGTAKVPARSATSAGSGGCS